MSFEAKAKSPLRITTFLIVHLLIDALAFVRFPFLPSKAWNVKFAHWAWAIKTRKGESVVKF